MDRYKRLCSDELDLVSDVPFKRITFLGSGFLPMTAILMTEKLKDKGITLRCVDIDKDACDVSRALIDKLDLSEFISVEHIDANDADYIADELIICASMLRNVEGIYNRIANTKGEYCVIRDAESVYQFSHKAAMLPDSKSYMFLKGTEPKDYRANTSKLYKKNRVI